MIRASASRAELALLTGIILSVGACQTNEKVVYPDQSGPTPPAAAASFVGYANTASKQTVCGNCHVDQQATWLQTNHAGAWKDLVASGHSSSACQDCHTVSANGNGATGSVGYTATQDPRYQDVQCESCHGAGLTHVTAPTLENRPLASIAVDTTTGTKFTCAGCHTGTHEPFVDQWKVSAHNFIASAPASERASGCGDCHIGQDALTTWGVTTNYVEQQSTTPQPITCAVCHDPHAKTNDHQLRFAIATTDTAKNLCMKCHNRNNSPTFTSSRLSSHAPETGTLLGYAGWFPPGLMTDPSQGGAIVATHGSSANPQVCATCHVARFSVNDPKTGNMIFQATGHTFSATPCLDSLGRPLGGTCAPAQQSFAACTASGCHGTQDAARSALSTSVTRLGNLVDQLNTMLAQVPATEKTALKYTVARGALFNISVVTAGHGADVLTRLGVNTMAGQAAHNPFLMEQLLTNSIKAVQTTYGIAPDKGLVLDNILPKH